MFCYGVSWSHIYQFIDLRVTCEQVLLLPCNYGEAIDADLFTKLAAVGNHFPSLFTVVVHEAMVGTSPAEFGAAASSDMTTATCPYIEDVSSSSASL